MMRTPSYRERLKDGFKRRKDIRQEAEIMQGELIFPLHNHDIFQFQSEEGATKFADWASGEKKVDHTEIGVKCRVAVKYKK